MTVISNEETKMTEASTTTKRVRVVLSQEQEEHYRAQRETIPVESLFIKSSALQECDVSCLSTTDLTICHMMFEDEKSNKGHSGNKNNGTTVRSNRRKEKHNTKTVSVHQGALPNKKSSDRAKLAKKLALQVAMLRGQLELGAAILLQCTARMYIAKVLLHAKQEARDAQRHLFREKLELQVMARSQVVKARLEKEAQTFSHLARACAQLQKKVRHAEIVNARIRREKQLAQEAKVAYFKARFELEKTEARQSPKKLEKSSLQSKIGNKPRAIVGSFHKDKVKVEDFKKVRFERDQAEAGKAQKIGNKSRPPVKDKVKVEDFKARFEREKAEAAKAQKIGNKSRAPVKDEPKVEDFKARFEREKAEARQDFKARFEREKAEAAKAQKKLEKAPQSKIGNKSRAPVGTFHKHEAKVEDFKARFEREKAEAAKAQKKLEEARHSKMGNKPRAPVGTFHKNEAKVEDFKARFEREKAEAAKAQKLEKARQSKIGNKRRAPISTFRKDEAKVEDFKARFEREKAEAAKAQKKLENARQSNMENKPRAPTIQKNEAKVEDFKARFEREKAEAGKAQRLKKARQSRIGNKAKAPVDKETIGVNGKTDIQKTPAATYREDPKVADSEPVELDQAEVLDEPAVAQTSQSTLEYIKTDVHESLLYANSHFYWLYNICHYVTTDIHESLLHAKEQFKALHSSKFCYRFVVAMFLAYLAHGFCNLPVGQEEEAGFALGSAYVLFIALSLEYDAAVVGERWDGVMVVLKCFFRRMVIGMCSMHLFDTYYNYPRLDHPVEAPLALLTVTLVVLAKKLEILASIRGERSENAAIVIQSMARVSFARTRFQKEKAAAAQKRKMEEEEKEKSERKTSNKARPTRKTRRCQSPPSVSSSEDCSIHDSDPLDGLYHFPKQQPIVVHETCVTGMDPLVHYGIKTPIVKPLFASSLIRRFLTALFFMSLVVLSWNHPTGQQVVGMMLNPQTSSSSRRSRRNDRVIMRPRRR